MALATAVIKEQAQLNDTDMAFAQFRVANIREGKCSLTSYNRRDFFKITLVLQGNSQLLYADRDITIDKPALVFTSPLVPFSWDTAADTQDISGFFCVFTDTFLHNTSATQSLQYSTLYKAGGEPVYFLTDAQVQYLNDLFTQMHGEAHSDYQYKYEVLQSQLNLLIHQALKMQPAVNVVAQGNASARITKLFLSLLNRQFPVDTEQPIWLKKASEYADHLAVHVNHLNAAVKEVTGQATTTHINQRIIAEAKSLLLHTDWSIADIAMSLGFEYTSYFNKFFKKHTHTAPTAYRKLL